MRPGARTPEELETLFEDAFVTGDRFIELANPPERRRAQIGMSRIGWIGQQQPVELGQGFLGSILSVKNSRKVGPGGVETRRKVERAAQQRLGVGIARDPPGKLGEHTDRSDVHRVSLKSVAQDRLGDFKPVFDQRVRCALELMIMGRRPDRIQFRSLGLLDLAKQPMRLAGQTRGFGIIRRFADDGTRKVNRA